MLHRHTPYSVGHTHSKQDLRHYTVQCSYVRSDLTYPHTSIQDEIVNNQSKGTGYMREQ